MIRNDDISRFWSKVDKSGPLPKHKPELGPCWTWLGSFTPSGYAQFHARGEITANTAHTFSFRLHHGPVPHGKEVDHECLNRGCPNPAHLRALTHQQNLLHGNSIPARNARKTHCPQGHEYSIENTIVNNRGERQCKACCSVREKRCRDNRRVLFQPELTLTEAA